MKELHPIVVILDVAQVLKDEVLPLLPEGHREPTILRLSEEILRRPAAPGEMKGPYDWEALGRGVESLAGAMTEAPFGGGRGAALVGGRYAYPGALLALIGSDIQLNYGDYQARVGYDLTPTDRITLFAFGAYDYLGQREGKDTRILVDTTFHRLDLRYDHRYGLSSSVRHAVTLGYDQTRLDEHRSASDMLLSARTEVTHWLPDDVPVRAGVDATLDRSRADLDRGDDDEEAFATYFTSRLDLLAGAYAEAALPVALDFEVTPGLRLDLYESQGEVALAVDPRVSARLVLTPDVTFFQAHGLASQSPSFILPGPGFRPPLAGGLQRSVQSSAGLEIALPEDVTAKVTLFRNAFFDMTDAFGTSPQNGNDPPSRFDLRANGSSEGLELSAHRRLTRRLGGFLSYTLSRSSRSFGRASIPSSFDRTHVVNTAATYDFTGGYRAGGRILFYSGMPALTTGPDGTPREREDRLPPFFRLDVRLEKRWDVGEAGWISAVLEVENATLSKEAIGIDCDGQPCEVVTIGPVTIPSIGVEGGF